MSTDKEFLKNARPLAESLLDHATTAGASYGITDAKVVIAANDRVENSVEKGQVTKTVAGKTYNVSVTLFAGDRTLSFSKNTLDEQALKDAMTENMKVIHLVPENAGKRLLDPAKVFKGAEKDLDLFDKNPPTQAEMIDYAKEVERSAMAQEGVKASRSVSVTKSEDHLLILATNGLDIEESRTSYAAGAAVIAGNAREMQIGGEYSIARHFNDMAKPKELGMLAGQDAVSKLDSTLPKTGEMPIVLDQSAAESFFASVYSAISGSSLHRGIDS